VTANELRAAQVRPHMAQTHTLWEARSASQVRRHAALNSSCSALDPTFIPAAEGLAQALSLKKYGAAIDYLKTCPAVVKSRWFGIICRNGCGTSLSTFCRLINKSRHRHGARVSAQLRPAAGTREAGCGIPQSVDPRSPRLIWPSFPYGRLWRSLVSSARFACNRKLRCVGSLGMS